MTAAVARVYLPSWQLQRCHVGLLIGWNSQRALTASVALVLHSADAAEVEAALRAVASWESWKHLVQLASGQPTILGEVHAAGIASPPGLLARRQAASLWLDVELRDDGQPCLAGLYSHGAHFRTQGQLILYPPVDRGAFLCCYSPSYTGKPARRTPDDSELPRVLSQLNLAPKVEAALQAAMSGRAPSKDQARVLIEQITRKAAEALESLGPGHPHHPLRRWRRRIALRGEQLRGASEWMASAWDPGLSPGVQHCGHDMLA